MIEGAPLSTRCDAVGAGVVDSGFLDSARPDGQEHLRSFGSAHPLGRVAISCRSREPWPAWWGRVGLVLSCRARRGSAVAERVLVREITNEEGVRLLRLVRRSSGSVVTWRRAQMVLLSAQGMDAGGIARVAFTSVDRVRDVIHNFNADGFASLAPKYAGGRPPKFTLPQRQAIKKIALANPADHGRPFSTWSLSKLAEFLTEQGVVDDISHEGLRVLLHEQGVSFQAVKTFKKSTDPDYEAKKNRVLKLYAITDGHAGPGQGEPSVVICMDEFGPLNLQPHPGKQWAPSAVGKGDQGQPRRRWRRATYTRPHGVRHLLAAYDLSTNKLYGHVKKRKTRTEFLAFCKYLRSFHPPGVRIAIVLDNFSPHLSTKKDARVGAWAAANNEPFRVGLRW